VGIIVILVSFVAAGALYQAVGAARSVRRFPAPGALVDVGGHRLHIMCLGHGKPTVLLESGIAASSLSWARGQPEVAKFTQVCAYDRAGLAWSDPATHPRTLRRIVGELHTVLTRAAAHGPHVMVGHSFGCFIVRAYAAWNPGEVGGMVLLDPPSEWLRMTPHRAQMLWGGIQLSRFGALLARLGVVRVCLALLTGGTPGIPRRFVKIFGPTTARTLERLVGEVRKLPRDVHPVVQALWCQPKCSRAMADHLRALESSGAEIVGLDPLADMPLVVISSGDQPPEQIAEHQALACLSGKGRHLVAAKSGHWIQFDQPELVVTAIQEVVEAARRPQRRAMP
jgi:pimeloyl-ACP methyl ester carboxylesterase